MKKIFVLIMVSVLMLFFISCGKSQSIVGKWKMEINDESGQLGFDSTITFTEDTMEFFGISMPYKLKGDIITIKEEEAKYSIDGDVLTITINGENMKLNRILD